MKPLDHSRIQNNEKPWTSKNLWKWLKWKHWSINLQPFWRGKSSKFVEIFQILTSTLIEKYEADVAKNSSALSKTLLYSTQILSSYAVIESCYRTFLNKKRNKIQHRIMNLQMREFAMSILIQTSLKSSPYHYVLLKQLNNVSTKMKSRLKTDCISDEGE